MYSDVCIDFEMKSTPLQIIFSFFSCTFLLLSVNWCQLCIVFSYILTTCPSTSFLSGNATFTLGVFSCIEYSPSCCRQTYLWLSICEESFSLNCVWHVVGLSFVSTSVRSCLDYFLLETIMFYLASVVDGISKTMVNSCEDFKYVLSFNAELSRVQFEGNSNHDLFFLYGFDISSYSKKNKCFHIFILLECRLF